MFELSVALKYLIPRWRQLSVSIISMISILVIGLAVWLVLVFFSATNGLQKMWVDKLIALTAPLRITPTEAYYRSFYYLSDSLSSSADYTLKTLGEKRENGLSYDPEIDETPPEHWSKPDLDEKTGQLKDLVEIAFEKIAALKSVPGIQVNDYEMTVGNLHLERNLKVKAAQHHKLSQGAYLGSIDPHNQLMATTTLPFRSDDLTYLYKSLILGDLGQEERFFATPSLIKERLERFYAHTKISALKTPENGWPIPRHLFPKEGQFGLTPLRDKAGRMRYVITEYIGSSKATQLKVQNSKFFIVSSKGKIQPLEPDVPIVAEKGMVIPAQVQKESIAQSSFPDDVLYELTFSLQKHPFHGIAPIRDLEFANVDATTLFTSPPEKAPFWAYQLKWPDGTAEFILPQDRSLGEAILLPKPYRDTHVHLGHRGFLSYYAPTTSTVQEMRVPVFVAGFYDPGIMPIGRKYVLTNKEITTLFRTSHNQKDTLLSNGINIRLDHLDQVDQVKERLQKSFEEAGIASYWSIETYREYEFTKDLIQQLHSDKNLLTLIATVIIIVACSNIISMLIILVNDKKIEVGILRSLGASSFSIATIFGLCGAVMGVVGSIIGTLCAFLTLYNLQTLIGWISWFQGYEMLNPVFYGDVIPSCMSSEALIFVFLATLAISLAAAIVPALKACLLRPSTTLRAE